MLPKATAGPGARDRHRCQAKSPEWRRVPQCRGAPSRLSLFRPEAKHHGLGKCAPSFRRTSKSNGFTDGYSTLQKCAAELCGHGHL